MAPGSSASLETQEQSSVHLPAAPWGPPLSSPLCLSHLQRPHPTLCHIPNRNASKLPCSMRSTCPTRVDVTFNCISAEVGRGRCPLRDLTQVPRPHDLHPHDLAGRTGTEQLLFCQTPLDKCSTFNNKLCKPNTKQFLASKLDFLFSKEGGKVQVISVLSGKTQIKQTSYTWPPGS